MDKLEAQEPSPGKVPSNTTIAIGVVFIVAAAAMLAGILPVWGAVLIALAGLLIPRRP